MRAKPQILPCYHLRSALLNADARWGGRPARRVYYAAEMGNGRIVLDSIRDHPNEVVFHMAQRYAGWQCIAEDGTPAPGIIPGPGVQGRRR